jgi:hypothetical protein
MRLLSGWGWQPSPETVLEVLRTGELPASHVVGGPSGVTRTGTVPRKGRSVGTNDPATTARRLRPHVLTRDCWCNPTVEVVPPKRKEPA